MSLRSSTRSAALIGIALLSGGIGWLLVLDYEHRDAPDFLNEWTAPWVLRLMVLSGVLLLICAGGTKLYNILFRRFRH